jgi:hypothetical protein
MRVFLPIIFIVGITILMVIMGLMGPRHHAYPDHRDYWHRHYD